MTFSFRFHWFPFTPLVIPFSFSLFWHSLDYLMVTLNIHGWFLFFNKTSLLILPPPPPKKKKNNNCLITKYIISKRYWHHITIISRKLEGQVQNYWTKCIRRMSLQWKFHTLRWKIWFFLSLHTLKRACKVSKISFNSVAGQAGSESSDAIIDSSSSNESCGLCIHINALITIART